MSVVSCLGGSQVLAVTKKQVTECQGNHFLLAKTGQLPFSGVPFVVGARVPSCPQVPRQLFPHYCQNTSFSLSPPPPLSLSEALCLSLSLSLSLSLRLSVPPPPLSLSLRLSVSPPLSLSLRLLSLLTSSEAIG